MNIITIFTDEHRHDLLGCAGNSIIKTPNIDAFAKSAVQFKNAFCCTPLCVPSRTSFFTGKYTHRTRITSNARNLFLDIDDASFMKSLKEKGYQLGQIGKNHTFKDRMCEEMFDCYDEYDTIGKKTGNVTEKDKEVLELRYNGKTGGLPTYHIEGLIDESEPFHEDECITSRIAQDAVTFIENRDKKTPFCLYLSFPDPHYPNFVCEPYFSMYDPEDMKLEGLDINWDEHPFKHFIQSQVSGYDNYSEYERKKILAICYGQITFIDKAVGTVLDTISRENIQDETIVVFTSDHGNFAGNYGLIGKTGGFYESLMRIPLIMRFPGKNKLSNTNAQISNIDIMPTIFDYLGFESPEGTQGMSFLKVLNGETDDFREEIYAELGSPEYPPPPIKKEDYPAYNEERSKTDRFWFIEYTTLGRSAMIRKNGWKYCYNAGDKEELYNYDNDPLELQNLANKSEYKEKQSELKNRLLEWLMIEPVKR